MKLLFRDSIHETIHLTLEPSPLCERQRKPLFPIRVSIRGYRLAGSIIIASRPFNNRLGPRHKGEGPRLVKNKLSKSRDPSPHLWTGRGQSVIIIRGCRCSIHPSLSGWGSQPLNKSNSVPRKTSATSPPFAWRSPCEAKSYEPSPPSPVHQWHYPSRCCRHRDFKEIDKEDAIRLVFLRQSAGEEEEDTAQGMTTIHGRSGRGGPRRRRVGRKTWGWRRIQRAGGDGFPGGRF